MIVAAAISATAEDEFRCRRRALRDSIICLGWLRILSVVGYLALYFAALLNSNGTMSTVIQVMVLVICIPSIVLALLMFLGAMEEKETAITVALALCGIIAAYNTVLGIMGATFFIRTGYYTMHFFLAVTFGFIAISFIPVICHDGLLLYAYRKHLKSDSGQS